MTYSPEKWVWTDADFDRMNWHDNKIHAFHLAYEAENYLSELILDIDFILQWTRTDNQGVLFWVAPATLVFHEAESVNFHFDLNNMLEITINAFEHSNGNWIVDCFDGAIEVAARGFTQYIRQPPMLMSQQILTLDQRGGVSFARTTPR